MSIETLVDVKIPDNINNIIMKFRPYHSIHKNIMTELVVPIYFSNVLGELNIFIEERNKYIMEENFVKFSEYFFEFRNYIDRDEILLVIQDFLDENNFSEKHYVSYKNYSNYINKYVQVKNRKKQKNKNKIKKIE